MAPRMNPKGQEPPLVSFFVLAYNQEKFIREAVEGAFAQTYAALEIILSDDCSPDRTFEIMQEMAAAYTGPHQIILNRNACNLGLIRHYNDVISACHGEFLIGAAGDDISLPERTSILTDSWMAAGKPMALVYSQVSLMDLEGCPCAGNEVVVARQPEDPVELLGEWGGSITGAALGFSRGLWEAFNPIREDQPCEDLPLLWRAAMSGQLIFINRALVRWRTGGGIWSTSRGAITESAEKLQLLRRIVRERRLLSLQICQDVRSSPTVSQRIHRAARRFRIESESAAKAMEAGVWGSAVLLLGVLMSVGAPSPRYRRIMTFRLRYFFEVRRNDRRFLWRVFFFLYDFLRGRCHHGRPSTASLSS